MLQANTLFWQFGCLVRVIMHFVEFKDANTYSKFNFPDYFRYEAEF